ncbi:MAG TPA: hypothetical protein ENJ34_04700 [Epsilonproteobacteria bacterium]|nr:hypothetical protein [Campylobacterota bacterium]
MQNDTQYIQENTIDLRELFTVLKRRRKMIWTVTILFTMLAIVYVLLAKPIYSGNVTLEVGQVADEQFSQGEYSSLAIRNLDAVNNLKNIVSKKFGVSVSVIKSTTLLTYSAINPNKDTIKNKLHDAVEYTLERHKENAKLYSGLHSNVHMTQLVNEITVGDNAIKPKKKLIIIVAFITGLMLSIFLAFFLEFLSGIKNKKV